MFGEKSKPETCCNLIATHQRECAKAPKDKRMSNAGKGRSRMTFTRQSRFQKRFQMRRRPDEVESPRLFEPLEFGA
jgi:hypothetical protein